MRRLQRTTLLEDESDWLANQTTKILDKPEAERAEEARRLWTSAKKNQQRNKLRHIQSKLQDMCSGLERCMYCEDSEGSTIDHFWPQVKAPERTFVWENLLYACAHCNSNEKRDQFPLAEGLPLLIDPTAEDPLDHLILVPRTGKFEARLDAATQIESAKGRASIQTFGLDRKILEIGRHDAWVALEELIIGYDRHLSSGNTERAEQVRQAICRHPFSSVLVHLLRMATIVPPALDATPHWLECFAALVRRPEIATWIGC